MADVVLGGDTLEEVAELGLGLVLTVVVARVVARVVVGMVGTKLSNLKAVMLATWRQSWGHNKLKF
jgi:hypothetical protein